MTNTNSRLGQPCAGVTIAGHPCKHLATGENGLCAWHDPERKRRACGGRIAKALGPKPCKGPCGRVLPRRLFPQTGGRSPLTGERYGGPVCSGCLERASRAAGVPVRHKRRNARGDVWCNHCERYLRPDAFRFVQYPSMPAPKFWAYCIACTQEIDRDRYHRTKFRIDKAAGAFERTKRKAGRRKQEYRERTKFVTGAIDTLRRRGFTKSEVAKLARVSMTQLYGWNEGTQRPTPAIEARFGELLVATSRFPLGDRPVRRRIPHPELAAILAATDGLDVRYPVRDRWRKQRALRAIDRHSDDLAA